MGYGTMATPLLLVAGFAPISIVPAVLLSQGVAAGLGTAMHVRYRNVDLSDLGGADARISAAMIAFGVAGVVVAVFVAVTIPAFYVRTYIGLLVVAMGALMVSRPSLPFSWAKVFGISALNGFDKAISGGGFGPVAVGGLLTMGHRVRNSVGIAVFTVLVINAAGVLLYFLLDAPGRAEAFLMATLSGGALLGGLVGPGLTARMEARRHLRGFALFIVAVGLLSLATTFARL